MVKMFTGSLFLVDIIADGNKPARSWGSEVNSETNSISGILNLENMKNTIIEKTSYANSNALEVNNTMNDVTFKKPHTKTYVLGSKLKTISFNNLSNDNDNILALLVPKFSGAKHLLTVKLCVLDRHDFKPVKSFMLDIELFAVPNKTISDKLIAVKKIFYQVDGFGEASTPLKFPEIIKSFLF
ncbi:hypothetical protein G9A89_009237 [Geosiphon pyriformis]|nr:hypothetical protein G9A89_009237 [Geosiphon pyriformis]